MMLPQSSNFLTIERRGRVCRLLLLLYHHRPILRFRLSLRCCFHSAATFGVCYVPSRRREQSALGRSSIFPNGSKNKTKVVKQSGNGLLFVKPRRLLWIPFFAAIWRSARRHRKQSRSATASSSPSS